MLIEEDSKRPFKEELKNFSKKGGVIDRTSGAQNSFLSPMGYDPALENTSFLNVKSQYEHFLNGSFIAPQEKKYFHSINPSTEELLCEVALGGKKDVDFAVLSAKKAQEKIWSKMSGATRGKYLFRIARILQERAKEFAVLETLDGGKPIKEARDFDVPLAIAHFFYYAGWADKLSYAFPAKKNIRALGVCAQIIPWNFPLLMAAWKIAPALATGNSVVLKPAETTSLTALLLAEVLQEAELPEGVVNIITGGSATGEYLIRHPDVNKIAFTGSTAVGKLIAHETANTNKKLSLELGGKSANIVFQDAAIDQAVEGVINGIYFNQGHVCCAGSRLLVEESIEGCFVEKLKRRMGTLRLGNPLDKNTDVGAINSAVQLQRIRKLVEQGKAEGGSYFAIDAPLPARGYYYPPSFFRGVSQAETINRVEIFGPVLAISTFRTPSEAIEKANNTHFGLAAGIWSDKASKLNKVASALKAGVIWMNSYNKFDPTAPFGGYFESGWGREGGVQGLFPYLEVTN